MIYFQKLQNNLGDVRELTNTIIEIEEFIVVQFTDNKGEVTSQ
jgi:hypothetical protein